MFVTQLFVFGIGIALHPLSRAALFSHNWHCLHIAPRGIQLLNISHEEALGRNGGYSKPADGLRCISCHGIGNQYHRPRTVCACHLFPCGGPTRAESGSRHGWKTTTELATYVPLRAFAARSAGRRRFKEGCCGISTSRTRSPTSFTCPTLPRARQGDQFNGEECTIQYP